MARPETSRSLNRRRTVHRHYHFHFHHHHHYNKMDRNRRKSRNWAGLNHDLLTEIADRLPSMESFRSFSRVCKSWKAAAAGREGYLKLTIFEGPWLLSSAAKDEEDFRVFSSISLGINTPLKIYLPEASKQHCFACKDWLFVTSPDGIDASLLHPLSRVHIHLPKLNTLSMYRANDGSSLLIKRAVISANPATNSDYMVIFICGYISDLVYWKSGDTSWTEAHHFGNIDLFFADIIYSDINKKLYFLDVDNQIFSCDIREPNPTLLLQFSGTTWQGGTHSGIADKSYFVELSGGKFLVVVKFIISDGDDGDFYHTDSFKVFEVNTKYGTSACAEVNDLGNKALFLGYNTSFVVECSEFNKCKPNCIYFTADYVDMTDYSSYGDEDFKDMGIYCVSDGSIRSLFDDKIRLSMMTPPMWIGPSS